MNNRNSKTNRDANRQNMATSIVKATIYSNLVLEGLKTISDLSNSELQENDDLCDSSKRKLESIVIVADTCIDTNKQSNAKYQKCSTYIKRGSVNIANRETGLIKNAITKNEDPYLISSIHHYEPQMGTFQRRIASVRNTKCHPSSLLPTLDHDDEVGMRSDTLTDSSYQIPTPPTNLPNPTNENKYHTPLQAVRIISCYESSTKLFLPGFPPDRKGSYMRKLSKAMIIDYMIEHQHVPVKKTALRKLSKTYETTQTLPHTTWTELTAPGRKPHLPGNNLNTIISTIHATTEGGNCLDRSVISQTVEKEIKEVWTANNDERYRHQTIPGSTMRRYIHRIMSHPTLNLQKSVSNKTESHSSAEWSIRSTISYLCVVLSTHYIHAEPSLFHSKKSSLSSSGIADWDLVEEVNNKVLSIHKINKDIKQLIPVLPHLVTSTDETTVFITSQVIKNEEVWYLFAKPCAANTIDSNRCDNYTTALSSDAHCRGLRITLNNTFTAAGRVAPAFVCVYGLSAIEMPGDEVVIVPIEGLVVGSD